jgi:DNA repair exonuclease SbcCD ATPase subunit
MPIDPDTNRELDNIRTHFETILNGFETRYNDQVKAGHEALRVALSANDKRLDAMNEFRGALSDMSASMITRHESETARAAIIEKAEQNRNSLDDKIDNEVRTLAGKLEQLGSPNWPLMASIVSVFLMMITGVWIVIGLKIDATLTPLALEIQEVKVARAADFARLTSVTMDAAASTQADTTTRTAVAQADQRLHNLEDGQNHDSAQLAALEQKLVEVETQFCASDIIRNLMHSNDLRVISIVWHALFLHSTYPTDDAYYPQVCNRSASPNLH